MDKKGVTIELQELMNVGKADMANQVVNHIMNNLVGYLEETYGQPDNVPKEVRQVVSVINGAVESIKKVCDEMVTDKFKGNFSLEGIKVDIPEENLVD